MEASDQKNDGDTDMTDSNNTINSNDNEEQGSTSIEKFNSKRLLQLVKNRRQLQQDGTKDLTSSNDKLDKSLLFDAVNSSSPSPPAMSRLNSASMSSSSSSSNNSTVNISSPSPPSSTPELLSYNKTAKKTQQGVLSKASKHKASTKKIPSTRPDLAALKKLSSLSDDNSNNKNNTKKNKISFIEPTSQVAPFDSQEKNIDNETTKEVKQTTAKSTEKQPDDAGSEQKTRRQKDREDTQTSFTKSKIDAYHYKRLRSTLARYYYNNGDTSADTNASSTATAQQDSSSSKGRTYLTKEYAGTNALKSLVRLAQKHTQQPVPKGSLRRPPMCLTPKEAPLSTILGSSATISPRSLPPLFELEHHLSGSPSISATLSKSLSALPQQVEENDDTQLPSNETALSTVSSVTSSFVEESNSFQPNQHSRSMQRNTKSGHFCFLAFLILCLVGIVVLLLPIAVHSLHIMKQQSVAIQLSYIGDNLANIRISPFFNYTQVLLFETYEQVQYVVGGASVDRANIPNKQSIPKSKPKSQYSPVKSARQFQAETTQQEYIKSPQAKVSRMATQKKTQKAAAKTITDGIHAVPANKKFASGSTVNTAARGGNGKIFKERIYTEAVDRTSEAETTGTKNDNNDARVHTNTTGSLNDVAIKNTTAESLDNPVEKITKDIDGSFGSNDKNNVQPMVLMQSNQFETTSLKVSLGTKNGTCPRNIANHHFVPEQDVCHPFEKILFHHPLLIDGDPDDDYFYLFDMRHQSPNFRSNSDNKIKNNILNNVNIWIKDKKVGKFLRNFVDNFMR